MIVIDRHHIDKSLAENADLLVPFVQRLIDLIEKNPTALNSVTTRSLNEAAYRCISDPTAKRIDTWNSIARAMQTSSAIFLTARKSDGEVEFPVECRIFRTAATGPTVRTDAEAWITALWLAMICRKRDRIDMLCAMPIDLIRASGAQYDPYVYHWIRALQTVWRGEKRGNDQLLAAMRGTDPENVDIASPELVLRILNPPMLMFYHSRSAMRPCSTTLSPWHRICTDRSGRETTNAITTPADSLRSAPSLSPAGHATQEFPSKWSPSTCRNTFSRGLGWARTPSERRCRVAAGRAARSVGSRSVRLMTGSA